MHTTKTDIVPKLSVALSVYNGERFLDEAIKSVREQTLTDFEFLILDDGSVDSSAAIASRHAAQDPRIRVISRENRGLVASLNQLLEEARAPLVARMDADDICQPQRFEKQIAFLAANPEIGVLGSSCDSIDEEGNILGHEHISHPPTHEDILQSIEDNGAFLCHPSVVFRRDLVRSVGGYHHAFRHCEDFDLWLRLASITRIANLRDRLLLYRHSPGQVSRRHATEQQIGHAVALHAYHRRERNLPDPTADLDRLPQVGQFDALFGEKGVDRAVRAHLARTLQYSPPGLRDEGFEHILWHVRDGGRREGMWRTVARLLLMGEPGRAARLAATLATA